MQHLPPNTTLQGGKYRIERVLGQGGFGITYRAMMKETASGKLGAIEIEIPVAIKEFFMGDICMRSDNSSYVSIPSIGSKSIVEQYRKKFVKEANNLASLSHPNIVKVIDVFQENGTDYYVMEYLEGGSLRDLVKQKGKIEEAVAIQYVKSIGDALSYMHTKHMCHYDVKPSNIMLDKKGIAKLIDFGISKNYDNSGNQTSSTPIGISEGFAPLEQYKQSVQEFSPQIDIYALGATLYYLITGKVPPEASMIFNDGLPELPPFISRSTRNAIEQAMQPRKKDRPKSMKAFIDILNNSQIAPEVKNSSSIEVEDKDDDSTYFVKEGDSIPNVEQEHVKLNDEKQASVHSAKKEINDKPKRKKKYFIWLLLIVILLLVVQYCWEEINHIDYTTYSERLVKAAEGGDAYAQFALGKCFYDGSGVSVNYTKAAEWFSKSEVQGNAEAQFYLGWCYHIGDGVSRDDSKAVELFTKSVEQGYLRANGILGDLYYEGKGITKDYSKAFELWAAAAEQGDSNAQYYLGKLYADGLAVKEDHTKSVNWLTKSAEQGHPIAQCDLAYHYFKGEVVSQDIDKAVILLTKSAEQDYPPAQYTLGDCFEKGIGVPKSSLTAIMWYRKAAAQGEENAIQRLKELNVTVNN